MRRRRQPREPRSIQLAYWQGLRRIVRRARELVDTKLIPLLPMLLERANPGHRDALPPGKRVNHVIEAIKRQIAKENTQERLERIPKQIGKLVSEHNARILASQGIEARLAGTQKQINAFTSENVALIRSVPADYLFDVERLTHTAMSQGLRHEELAKALANAAGVTEARAKLIARDQVLKFNGSLNKTRQQAAGVTHYTWRSSEDERTRDAHADFDGNTYAWDDPPGDGSPGEGTHPGTAINCRCWSDPIVPEIEP